MMQRAPRHEVLDIVVADEDPAVRDSLSAILRAEGFQVRVYRIAEFLAVANATKPDCVLLGVPAPGLGGLETLQALGGADYAAPIIIVAAQGSIPMAVSAIKAGAHDFLEKPLDGEMLVERIREAVSRHSKGRPSGHLPRLRQGFPGAEMLTARELEVLDQIAGGASNKEAGRILGISPRTVEVHRARIMEKLGARNTADLMRIIFTDGER